MMANNGGEGGGSRKREGTEVAFVRTRRKKWVLLARGGRCERQRGGVQRQETALRDLGAPRVAGDQSSELTIRGSVAAAGKRGSTGLPWAWNTD